MKPLRAGVNPERCPTCGEAMSLPHRGRKTGTWIRTCSACQQQTIATAPPPPVVSRGPVRGSARAVDVELPFPKFNPQDFAHIVDVKARAVGSE